MRWLVVLALVACKKGEERPDPLAKRDAAASKLVVDAAPPIDAAPKEQVTPVKVAVGEHFTCVLISDGTLRCWGKNNAGQLGDGSTKDSLTPVTPKLTGVKDIALGAAHACALLDDNSVTCWGKINTKKSDNLLVPTAPGVTSATRVFAVGGAGCATVEKGELVCWGDVDAKGRLRKGGEIQHRPPTPVPKLAGITEIATTGEDTCVLREDGVVLCLGGASRCGGPVPKLEPATKAKKPAAKPKPKKKVAKAKPKKGKASKVAKAEPVKTEPPEGFDMLQLPAAKHLAFDAGLCVVTMKGSVKCLAQKTCHVIEPWPALASVDLVAGACARLAAGSVRCWSGKAATPRPVIGVKQATAIAASTTHSCAVLPSHTVACWGSNKHGALGRGKADDRLYPEASAAAL